MRSTSVKKACLFILVAVVISSVCIGMTALTEKENSGEKKTLRIVTSFYPIYIATKNVVKDMDGIEVDSMATKQTGCLHDYTLTTTDMKKLENADILIMNGSGMENYVSKVSKNYKNLKIIDTSKGAKLLQELGDHDHDHEHDHEEEDADHEHEHEAEDAEHEHEEGEFNAHIWLNPDNYKLQINNIAAGLSQCDPANKVVYEKNAKLYNEKVNKIERELKELSSPDYKETIIFHDSFAYVFDFLHVNVVDAIEIEKDTSLSAGDVANIIDEIKEHNIQVIFTEKQFDETIANRISDETGAKVYVLDSLVSGEDDLDEYLNGMEKNIGILRKALYQNSAE